MRVLLVDPIDPSGGALLRQKTEGLQCREASFDGIRRDAADADAVITRSRLPDDIFDAAPRLRAASIHFLAAIDNGGYFEGDVSKANKFRDELCSRPYEVDRDGNVWPLDKPGLGLEVNEEFLKKHPAIEGPGYI